MNYKEAVSLAKDGKDAGFQYLYESTYKSKYYLAVKYMKNEDAAQDVLQDAYLKAFSQLDTLQDPEKFPSWLGIIVGNTAKNALKKNNPLLFSEVMAENDEEPFEYEVEDESTCFQPEISYTQKETQMLVRELIDSLSEEQRICILMFEIEGISIKDIAAALQCSENTVKSRLNYGRKNIKKKAEALQKKGYKLYSLAPLPLFLWLLRAERTQIEGVLEAAQVQAEASVLTEVRRISGRATAEAAKSSATHGAGNAASGAAHSAASAAAKAGTAGAAKTGFIYTAAGKLTAAVLSLTVVGGGVTYGIHQANKKPEPPVTEITQVTEEVWTESASLTEPVPENQPAKTTESQVQQPTDADSNQPAGVRTREEAFEAFLDQMRGKKTVDIFTEYVEDFKDFPDYVTYMEEHPEVYYMYHDMDGDGQPELILKGEGLSDQGVQIIPLCRAFYCQETPDGYEVRQFEGIFKAKMKPNNGYGFISNNFSRGTGVFDYYWITTKDGALHFDGIPEYEHIMGTEEGKAIEEKINAENSPLEWILLT